MPNTPNNYPSLFLVSVPQIGNLIEGSEIADGLTGTDDIDFIKGFDDDDLLIGGGERDFLIGGAGDDTLLGGKATISSIPMKDLMPLWEMLASTLRSSWTATQRLTAVSASMASG
jgi:hypothetical protein